MNAILDKIDKNGTKYYHTTTCWACGGTGTRPEYMHVENGRCFVCDGSGYKYKAWKEYTPEYQEVLNERRLARYRKNADKTNAEFFKKEGLNENGEAWICLGNTFAIKDQLKEAGARYNAWLGWHFDHEMPNTVKLSVDDMCEKNICNEYSFKPVNFIKQAIEANFPEEYKSHSQYIGEVGDKLTVEVKLIDIKHYTTHISYYGEFHSVYVFADMSDNTIIWDTTSLNVDIKPDQHCTITGKVKEHKEYHGVKQTVLTRCKLSEIV